MAFFGFSEVASGEAESLVKVKRPEDKRKRPYHHPDDRMIHYQYGRYQMAQGECGERFQSPSFGMISATFGGTKKCVFKAYSYRH